MLLRFLKCPRVWLVAAVLPSVFCFAAESDTQPKLQRTWLVVTRPMFAGAIKPLADHRRNDGFHVVVSTDAPNKAIAAAGKDLAFILLVGDDEQGRSAKPWYVPARRVKGYYWYGSRDRVFASDSIYGDLDGDSVPDIPVGRIPARTVEQVAVVVRKILSYEAAEPALGDLALPFWAGSPMYGEMLDAAATTFALGMIKDYAPSLLTPWVQTADRNHPMCGWPGDHQGDYTRRLQAGGAFAVLMGHGDESGFYGMSFEGRTINYGASVVGRVLDKGPVAPPLIVYTCSSGNFTAASPCMTESFIFMPAGPVAVVGATHESHPLPNAYSALGLLRAVSKRPRRLGTLWLDSQLRGQRMKSLLAESVLRHAEGQIGLDSDVARLKRDQPLLYALLGDPATRLRLPAKLSGKKEYRDGKWHWSITKPAGATRLIVQWRPILQIPSRYAAPLAKDEARKAKAEANKAFEFQTIAELDAAAEWSGSYSKEGKLRFVATGLGKLYAAAITLKHPATE